MDHEPYSQRTARPPLKFGQMEQSAQDMGDESSTILLVIYLPLSLKDEDFWKMFHEVGRIKSAEIIRHKTTGISYGYGFVEYEKPDDADRAIATLNRKQLQDEQLKVVKARVGGENIKRANLFIRNLPAQWKEFELIRLFEPYGKIIQSKVLLHPNTGMSKRAGFVLYNTRFEADMAMRSLNWTVPKGCNTAIRITLALDNNLKDTDTQHVPSPMFPHQWQGPMHNQGNMFHNSMSGNCIQSSVPSPMFQHQWQGPMHNQGNMFHNSMSANCMQSSVPSPMFQHQWQGHMHNQGNMLHNSMSANCMQSSVPSPMFQHQWQGPMHNQGNMLHNSMSANCMQSPVPSPMLQHQWQRPMHNQGNMLHNSMSGNCMQSSRPSPMFQHQWQGPMHNQGNMLHNSMSGNCMQSSRPSPMFPHQGPIPRHNHADMLCSRQNMNQDDCTVCVSHIGSNATKMTLLQLFWACGKIQEVDVVMDQDENVCKGYGFVTMSNVKEAQNAIDELNGFIFKGRHLRVSFKTNK